MSKKGFLAGAFFVATGIGGGMTWLAQDNAAARESVAKSGYTVTMVDTGILWGDRHGCPVTGSGTQYVAKDADGKDVSGVICRPLFGKPRQF